MPTPSFFLRVMGELVCEILCLCPLAVCCWRFLGPSLAHVQHIIGTYSEHTWQVLGTYLEHTWNKLCMHSAHTLHEEKKLLHKFTTATKKKVGGLTEHKPWHIHIFRVCHMKVFRRS